MIVCDSQFDDIRCPVGFVIAIISVSYMQEPHTLVVCPPWVLFLVRQSEFMTLSEVLTKRDI